MLNPTEKIYGPNPRARNIMLGVWLLFAVSLTLFGLIDRDPAILLVAVIFSAITLPIFWYVLHAAKLVLTVDGIELRQVGASVSTPWGNIAAVRMQRGAEGLVLHQPMTGKGAERLAAVSGISVGGAPMYDEVRRQLLYEKRFIPLNGFSYWLHKGDLHGVIKERATAIVDDAALASSAVIPPPPVKLSRLRIALIVALIVTSAGLGITAAIVPSVMAIVERGMACLLMLALGVYALINLNAAAIHFRAGRYGWFTLWLLVAVMQGLFAFAALGWMVGQ
jgi:hypothetical protein